MLAAGWIVGPIEEIRVKTPLLIGLLVLTLSIGCQSQNATEPAPVIRELPPQSFTPVWSSPLALQKSNPAIALHVRENQVFVYSKDHTSYVLNRRGGQIEHAETVQTLANLAPPVVQSDQIIYPTNTTLAIYDFKGKLVRTVQLPASMRSNGAAGLDDLIVLGTDNSKGGRIVAMDLTREYDTPRWELMTRRGVSSTPAILQGAMYAASEDGGVYAVNRERTAIWPVPGGVFHTDGPILADVVVDEYGVYIASTDSKLYCLGRADGKVRWQYFAGSQLTAAPAVTDDFVYQLVPGEGMVAITKTQGDYNRTSKWTVKEARLFLAEDKTYAYFRSTANRIIAVEKASGSVKFQSETKFDLFGSNTFDSTIYVGRKSGKIYALTVVLVPGKTGELVLFPAESTLASN